MVKSTEIFTGEQQALDFTALSRSPLDSDNAPMLDLDLELCGAVKAAIAGSHRSRAQIVDRMNLCLTDSGYVITLRKLNAWLAPSQGDKSFPAWALPALCWATGSILPLERLMQPMGYEPADMREQQALALGQALIDEQKARRRASQLKKIWSK